jgi:hypothetical protein
MNERTREMAPARRGPRLRRKGMLTLEWILIVTVVCIGVVGALAVVRNALVTEFVELTDVICDTNVGV